MDNTLERVSGSTEGWLFMTLETVDMETPAFLATNWIVGFIAPPHVKIFS